jgi:hypothetical protein
MNALMTKQDVLVQTVLDGMRKELDEREIGGGYNTSRLMEYFREKKNQ